MKVRIEKEKYSSVKEIGHSNAKFYGWCFCDGKRYGSVWKFNDGKYVCNQDYNRRLHDKDNRPKQFSGYTLAELKKAIEEGC